MNIFILILWIITGIGNISNDEIDKVDYILCWSVLILELLINVLE